MDSLLRRMKEEEEMRENRGKAEEDKEKER